jgi:hypothetical protein
VTDVAHLRALAFAARAASGCSDVLGDALKGGLRADVLNDGEIRVGDDITAC